MLKNEKLDIIFRYACEKGFCRNKKTFAEFIGVSKTNISKIFADTNDRFCTNGVLLKANAALNNVFSTQWLLNSTGDMFAVVETEVPVDVSSVADSSDRVRELEYIVETQKKLIALLEHEVDELKKEILFVTENVKHA